MNNVVEEQYDLKPGSTRRRILFSTNFYILQNRNRVTASEVLDPLWIQTYHAWDRRKRQDCLQTSKRPTVWKHEMFQLSNMTVIVDYFSMILSSKVS